MYVGVVVAYNPQREEICKNIDTYINELDVLYVVDNSSKNNGDIFNGYNKVKYIPNYDNLGISAALNIGAKEAINNKYKWILTMEQDSHFEKDAISKMKEYINNSDKTNEKLGIVSPFHLTKRTEGIKLEGVDYPILVMTSGNLLNLEAYLDVGGFPEWYFIDCVDFDFCLALRKKGYEIAQINDAVLQHELGDTVRRQIGKKVFYLDNHNYIRRYYVVRNRHYFYDRYKNDFPEYCELEKKCTRKEALKVLLFEKDKYRKLTYMYKGYRDYKAGLVGRIDRLSKKSFE